MRIALAATLLLACSEPARFEDRPVSIDAQVDGECVAGLEVALEALAGYGVSTELSPHGAVHIRQAKQARGDLAITGRTFRGGAIVGAQVRLGSCDARVIAHELGHVLGLEHVRAEENLMHWAYELGGWELTEDQLDRIAD